MYCKSCGHVSADGGAYCPKCGAALAVDFELPPIVKSETVADVASPAALARAQAARERFASEWPEEWDFDEELWRRAIGPHNTDFYLLRFEAIHNGESTNKFRWHWPACFVTFLWLLHRRMWGWAAAYYVWSGGTAFWLVLLFSRANSNALQTFDYFITPLALQFGVLPMYATRYYHGHLKSLIASEKKKHKVRAVVLQRVEERGGTGKGAVYGALGILALTIAMGIAVHHIRANVAKTRTAVTAGFGVVGQVATYIRMNRRLPPSLAHYTEVAGVQQNILGVGQDPTTGVITLQITFGGGTTDGTIYFEPRSQAEAGRVEGWRCVVDGRLQRYAPKECQS
jgi:Protein of unknown function (DUF2628)